MFNNFSRPLIVRHFGNLEGVELLKCGTIGSLWDILVHFHPSTVDRPKFLDHLPLGLHFCISLSYLEHLIVHPLKQNTICVFIGHKGTDTFKTNLCLN